MPEYNHVVWMEKQGPVFFYQCFCTPSNHDFFETQKLSFKSYKQFQFPHVMNPLYLLC